METQGGFLISQIKYISDRVWERILKEGGVADFNGAQGKLLYVLWEHDGISAAELAKRSGLAPTTLTTMLDRMEKAELLKRVPHETDRRRIRLCLTPKAKALKEQGGAESQRMNDAYYTGFTEEEVRAFEAYLTRVLENLRKAENEPPERVNTNG